MQRSYGVTRKNWSVVLNGGYLRRATQLPEDGLHSHITHIAGRDINAMLPARATRPAVLRQRGRRAEDYACRLAPSLALPLRHHNCATAPLHPTSARIHQHRGTSPPINGLGVQGYDHVRALRGFSSEARSTPGQQRVGTQSHSRGRWQASNIL